MKLICLNLWGGKIYEPLAEFLKNHQDTDIFCFQETLNSKKEVSKLSGTIFKDGQIDLYKKISQILKNHNGFFAPMIDLVNLNESDFPVPLGQSIFVRKDLKILDIGDLFVHGQGYNIFDHSEGFANSPRNVQYIGFEKNGRIFWVFNYHGVWVPGHKVDNKHRLAASKKLKRLIDSKKGVKILTGDFNLLPDTESLKMLTKNMRELILENNITSTRSSHFKKPLEAFSDYMIISIDAKVKNFEVLKDEVSDHLPLLLEFE